MQKLGFITTLVAIMMLASCQKEEVASVSSDATNQASEDRSGVIVNTIKIDKIDPLTVCALTVTVRNYYTNAVVYSGAISTYLPYTFSFITSTDAEYKVNVSVTPWYPNENGRKFTVILKKAMSGQAPCTQGPWPGIPTPYNGPLFGTGDSWEQCYY